MNLREKIAFIRVTQSQDSTGQLVNTELIYYEPKGAYVREITPSNDLIIQQENISTLIEVKIRYNPEIAIILGDKIEWRGFRFNALAPKIDPMRNWIMIKAFSEIETTDRSGGDIPDINWDGGSPGSTYEYSVDGGII
jgi:hypothetical protein